MAKGGVEKVKPLVAVSILFLLILSVFIFPASEAGSGVFYISLAFAACALSLSSWNSGISGGLKYLRLAPGWKDAPSLLLQTLALFAACVVVTVSITGAFMLAGALDTKNVYDKVILLPLPVLVLAFTLAPLCEEMFFRGFLFRKASEWVGRLMPAGIGMRGGLPWAAGALLSSLLFAAMHASYGSYAELAVAFSVGAVLCIGVKKTGSLVPAVLAHAAFNFASVFMAVFL
ncbi:MAG: type II CAAX endopeptidase family protein [Candidatus Micrarchaeia archaeon]|jgi:membrane protease YdiL (CAAX protease family)